MLTSSLFWEFHRHDQPASSAVVGTIHLSIELDEQFLQKIDHLINKYERIFTETSLSNESNSYLNHHVFVEPGTWDSMISPRRTERINKALKRVIGITLEDHRNLRPLFVMSLIYEALQGTNGLDRSVDHLIWKLAKGRHKEVGGLETIEEQVRTMKSLSLDYEYRQLAYLGSNLSASRKQMKKLVSLYQNEDIKAIYRKTRRSLGPNRKLLLYDRNQRITDRIIQYHKDRPSLFTFGAGHLSGKFGVLRLLKQAGYCVRPLNM